MITISVPGFRELRFEHLVLDFNGTLAVDGQLIDGVAEYLQRLSAQLQIHVLTADTFGRVKEEMAAIPCTVSILPPDKQDVGKRQYVQQLGPEACVCVGNGRNDRLMLKEAALGIAVVQAEGASAQTVMAADIVVSHVVNAFELLSHPLRLTATLRS